MKKMLVAVCVVAFAFAACGKKKDAAAPTGGTTEPAGSAAGSDTAPPADGSAAGSAEAAPATP